MSGQDNTHIIPTYAITKHSDREYSNHLEYDIAIKRGLHTGQSREY